MKWKNKIHVPNHQPAIMSYPSFWGMNSIHSQHVVSQTALLIRPCPPPLPHQGSLPPTWLDPRYPELSRGRCRKYLKCADSQVHMCQSVVTLKIQCLHLNHQNLARKLGDVHLAITMTILGRARCPGPATLAAFRQLERKRHGRFPRVQGARPQLTRQGPTLKPASRAIETMERVRSLGYTVYLKVIEKLDG